MAELPGSLSDEEWWDALSDGTIAVAAKRVKDKIAARLEKESK